VTLLALPCIYSLLDDARLSVRRMIRDARGIGAPRAREPIAALAAIVPPSH
jgi:hypothetical protein